MVHVSGGTPWPLKQVCVLVVCDSAEGAAGRKKKTRGKATPPSSSENRAAGPTAADGQDKAPGSLPSPGMAAASAEVDRAGRGSATKRKGRQPLERFQVERQRVEEYTKRRVYGRYANRKVFSHSMLLEDGHTYSLLSPVERQWAYIGDCVSFSYYFKALKQPDSDEKIYRNIDDDSVKVFDQAGNRIVRGQDTFDGHDPFARKYLAQKLEESKRFEEKRKKVLNDIFGKNKPE